MRGLLFLVMVAISAPSFAQHKGKGQQGMSHEERRRMREDVDSARGNYGRQAPPRDRMSPEERERLRRDVQDASRDLRRR